MLRYVFRLVLLFAVFHHGAALPGTWQGGVASDQAAQHVVMHWQGVQHHHHDGGLHKHGGADSSQHMQVDNLLQSPALMPVFPGPAVPAAMRLPIALPSDAEPETAFLEQPDRPPRNRR